MISTPTNIITVPEMRDGHMIGLDVNGVVIVEIQVCPIFKRIQGTEDDDREVVTWRVGKNQARRIAAVAAWRATGHMCGGRA